MLNDVEWYSVWKLFQSKEDCTLPCIPIYVQRSISSSTLNVSVWNVFTSEEEVILYIILPANSWQISLSKKQIVCYASDNSFHQDGLLTSIFICLHLGTRNGLKFPKRHVVLPTHEFSSLNITCMFVSNLK